MADSNRSTEEPLDPFLKSLYEEEAAQSLELDSNSFFAEVLGRLADAPTTLPAVADPSVPPPPTASPAATTGVAKGIGLVLFSLVAGAVIGISIDRHFRNPSATYVVLEQSIADAGSAAPVADALPTYSADVSRDTSFVIEDAAPRASKVPSSKEKARGASVNVKNTQDTVGSEESNLPPHAREAHLINRARTALRRGLHSQALLALMKHERVFPEGKLAEERDVLVIEVYAALGKTKIARKRIESYKSKYTKGFLRGRVIEFERNL